MTRRFVVKHLAKIPRIHPLAAAPAAIRQFALLREWRVELLGDPARKRVVEFESVKCVFADHASITRPREFGSGGNLGNIGARARTPATSTGISALFSLTAAVMPAAIFAGRAMYALFLEQQDGHLEWFCAAPDEERARVVARFSSKYGSSPVVVIKQSHGSTTSIAAFRDGRPVPLKH